MARALLDLDSLDLTHDVMEDAEIRSMVPQAHEFQMIDGICHLDIERGCIVGYKDWAEDAWWARGHVPGRPLMPGVLMVESCAQVATILMKKKEGWPPESFIGLGGLNDVRFRGQVVPPCRVHYVSMVAGRSSRKVLKYPAQCYLDGKMIMQMELMGIAL